MAYRIEEIEGIGASYAAKLAKAGILTTGDLLGKCATPTGRDAVSRSTGISGRLILAWANKADLLRVKGIGAQYSELLEAAGVGTVKDLRTRVAEHLAARIKAVNMKKRLVRQVPSQAQVETWIATAKKLACRMK